jgi:hypothetical protein
MVERLQVKASSIGRILTNLEKKYHDRDEAMKKSPSGQSLGNKRQTVTIQRIPAFNPNKIRKSPSSEAAAAAVAQEEAGKSEEASIETANEPKNPPQPLEDVDEASTAEE